MSFECNTFTLIPEDKKEEESELKKSTGENYVYLRFEDNYSKKDAQPTFRKKSSLYLYKLINSDVVPYTGQIIRIGYRDNYDSYNSRLRVEGVFQADISDLFFLKPNLEIKEVFWSSCENDSILEKYQDKFKAKIDFNTSIVSYDLVDDPNQHFTKMNDLVIYFKRLERELDESFEDIEEVALTQSSIDPTAVYSLTGGGKEIFTMTIDKSGLPTADYPISAITSITTGSISIAEDMTSVPKIINKKEKKNMNIFKDLTFGKVENNSIKVSFKGLAFKNYSNDYIVYDTDGNATNVNDMVFDIPLYCFPTALSKVKKNDIIFMKGGSTVGIVREVKDKSLVVIKPATQEIVEIVSDKSIFGFDYVSKVMNPLEAMGGTANENNPFGNMLPLMMLSEKDSDGDNNMKMMLMMSMMGSGNAGMNPMLPFLLMSDGKKGNDMMMLMMMGGMGNPFGVTNTSATEVEGNQKEIIEE